jgi:purine-binding chemotaxis protein CheW
MFKLAQQIELDEYIGFEINQQPYCINIEFVQEIIYVPLISKIPSAPGYIEGAINLRGKIIRVLNLRKWFRLPWKAIDRATQIIIIDLKTNTFGILVDRVFEVFRCSKETKHEIPFLLAQQTEIAYSKSIITEKDQIFIEIQPDVFLNSN